MGYKNFILLIYSKVASSGERITAGCICEENGLPVCSNAQAGGSVSC